MAGSRYVMLGFPSEEEAEDFLNKIDPPDGDAGAVLPLAIFNPETKKHHIKWYKLRTAYLKDI